jgi:prolipoprotein diacylglyceryltransferase
MSASLGPMYDIEFYAIIVVTAFKIAASSGEYRFKKRAEPQFRKSAAVRGGEPPPTSPPA